MTAVSHHRKDLMIEARFLPESIEQATRLRNRIYEIVAAGEVDGIAPGQAEAYADQVTGWLVGKTEGVDRKGPNTRAKYRKILQTLEEQVPGGREGGFARHPGILGVLGLVGAGAVASAAPGASAALLVFSPIIYAPECPDGPERRSWADVGELELAAA